MGPTGIRAAFVAALLLALSTAGGAAAKPGGPGPGNAPNAKACQKGEWAKLYTSTGDTFSSEAACTAHAAGGGTLLTSPPTWTLTVSKLGTGAGTVTSAPGIACGSDCSEGYSHGTSVTLTATAGAGSTFAGWSGACSGTASTCVLAMTANTTAIATFDAVPPPPPPPPLLPDIYLGFADNFHDSIGFPNPPFPDPWAGDPGVVFLGCNGFECGFDDAYSAGAIRIDNPLENTASLTLTRAYVDIGPCHFEPWVALLEGGVTAAPGESLILTQTGQLGPAAPAPCDAALNDYRVLTNFDTSLRPDDSPGDFHCDTEGAFTPVITLVFDDGTTLKVTDADRVLNTGGFSRFVCLAENMATPWTAVDAANVVATP